MVFGSLFRSDFWFWLRLTNEKKLNCKEIKIEKKKGKTLKYHNIEMLNKKVSINVYSYVITGINTHIFKENR